MHVSSPVFVAASSPWKGGGGKRKHDVLKIASVGSAILSRSGDGGVTWGGFFEPAMNRLIKTRNERM